MSGSSRVARRIAARLIGAVAVVVVVTTAVFVLLHLAPGDPFGAAIDNPNVTESVRAHWRAAYGLDRPVLQQYALYLENVMRGDLGWSFSLQRPVRDVLVDALPYTLLLTAVALAIGFIAGVGIAVAQARRVDTLVDRTLGTATLFLYAMPDFWLALVLMLALAYHFGWFPIGGAVDPVMHDDMSLAGRFGDRIWHLALPALTLGAITAAGIARYQRAELLRVLPEDYVRTARAKGLSERSVVYRHALRNALIPTISLLGLAIPALVTGAVFVERVYAWPGMGWVIVNAVAARDYPLVTAAVLVTASAVVAGSALADVLHSLVDPRARHG